MHNIKTPSNLAKQSILYKMNLTRYEPLNKEQILAFLQINLPADIKHKIYDDYFKIGIIYNKKYNILIDEIHSIECIRLNPVNLLPIVKSVIENPQLCLFVQAKNPLFNKLYKRHYIENNKYFALMNTFDSLVLTWLMHLYH